MNEKEFEEELKKALESGIEENEESGEMNSNDMAKMLTNMVKMGSMIEISKAAGKRITAVVDDLKEELSKLDKKDLTRHHAKAVFAIQKAAKELNVLYTLMVTSSITGVAVLGDPEESYDSILNTIIKVITR